MAIQARFFFALREAAVLLLKTSPRYYFLPAASSQHIIAAQNGFASVKRTSSSSSHFVPNVGNSHVTTGTPFVVSTFRILITAFPIRSPKQKTLYKVKHRRVVETATPASAPSGLVSTPAVTAPATTEAATSSASAEAASVAHVDGALAKGFHVACSLFASQCATVDGLGSGHAVLQITANVVEEGRLLVVAGLVCGGSRNDYIVGAICGCVTVCGSLHRVGHVAVSWARYWTARGDCLLDEVALVELRVRSIKVIVLLGYFHWLALASTAPDTSTSAAAAALLTILYSHLVDLLGKVVNADLLRLLLLSVLHGTQLSHGCRNSCSGCLSGILRSIWLGGRSRLRSLGRATRLGFARCGFCAAGCWDCVTAEGAVAAACGGLDSTGGGGAGLAGVCLACYQLVVVAEDLAVVSGSSARLGDREASDLAVHRSLVPRLGYLGSHVDRQDLESVIAAEIGLEVGRSQRAAGWGKEGRRIGLVAERVVSLKAFINSNAFQTARQLTPNIAGSSGIRGGSFSFGAAGGATIVSSFTSLPLNTIDGVVLAVDLVKGADVFDVGFGDEGDTRADVFGHRGGDEERRRGEEWEVLLLMKQFCAQLRTRLEALTAKANATCESPGTAMNPCHS
ncbi:hypothetical protein KC356_g86 [Hortaea werneckii]|nr:hypothetical protein KC356_g86 [Hortaea werneckii]